MVSRRYGAQKSKGESGGLRRGEARRGKASRGKARQEGVAGRGGSGWEQPVLPDCCVNPFCPPRHHSLYRKMNVLRSSLVGGMFFFFIVQDIRPGAGTPERNHMRARGMSL